MEGAAPWGSVATGGAVFAGAELDISKYMFQGRNEQSVRASLSVLYPLPPLQGVCTYGGDVRDRSPCLLGAEQLYKSPARLTIEVGMRHDIHCKDFTHME